MTELRYPRSVVTTDALRGVAGCAVALFVCIAVGPVLWLNVLLIAVAAVFAVFAIRALARSRQRFCLETGALHIAPGNHRAAWSDLASLRLSYFSTRRDHREGWLELKLRIGAHSVCVDSRLNGFEALLDRALAAARRNRLPLSAATCRNLDWLGRETVTHSEAATDA